MLKNYIKVAWRNLIRDKGFSFINITGLAIGMAAAILILLWIQNEMNMDRKYPKSDRIYMMYNRDKFSGELWAWGTTPKIMGTTIKKDYPEVEDVVRLADASFLFTQGEKKLNENGLYADSGYMKLFDFEMLQGDPENALKNTFNIVISEEFAIKLFGTTEAMGKTVKIDSVDIFTVSGVLKKVPNTSRFDVSYILPWSYMKKLGQDDEWWGNNSIVTYVLLKENVSLESFNSKVREITIKHTQNTEVSSIQVFAYPLSKIHLYGKSVNGQLVEGRIVTVRMFAVIASLILLIACINFMNLSTAKSEKRAKEVGIRKVAGAGKASLIGQFIGEGIMLAFISGIIAIILVQLTIEPFNNLVVKKLFLDYGNAFFWLSFIVFILLTGIIAGSYPAFYLSSFNPVKVLKGTFKSARSPITARKILVVLQFTFAIALIISTIIIQRQIKYAEERDAGYNKENLIYAFMQGDITKHYDAIKQSLLSSDAVVAVTKSMSPITERWSDGWGYSWPGSTEEDKKLDFIRFSTDADFTKVFGTKIVAGRDIDITKYPSDSNAILLNETAVKKMRLKDPIGTVLKNGDNRDGLTVVGVIQDYIYESPYEPVSPLIIMGPGGWFNVIHIRLNPAKPVADNISAIEKVFTRFNPHYPFSYEFVDESYAQKFNASKRTGTLSMLFSALTIIISCLGLFGLSAYMAANRTKEIGVRKVLGASVSNITFLLSTDFLKLVVISFIIASPIAWYAMTQWLKEYTYRIDIEWWIFAITGILSIAIALITVSFQAIKAATANPVKSLRTE
ncbi:ABC transporter permease [Polluticaenibacter yanchengensis]|uniref:ABC transporter permease n=1 Tax=Polluticaenibacter yanchengensis TaxID=3014562 RepID=A0ABT4UPF7_9BACT|nr:ABC transporter permease [Chitinophagaceae bacterium LY-5]